MPRHMRGVITPSLLGRGGCDMRPSSAGSKPSARAGGPSVTRLIQRICVASSGSTDCTAADVETDLPGQHDTEEHRHHFTDIRREEVSQELPDVRKDGTAFLNRSDNRCEVVVGQHHVRRRLRHVRARDAHCDADVGLLQCRRIIDAVTSHGHDRPQYAAVRRRSAVCVRGSHARIPILR